jgi:4'-phosphopantetheinyl transferase
VKGDRNVPCPGGFAIVRRFGAALAMRDIRQAITHPESFPFPVTEVDVWRASLRYSDGELEQLASFFPQDEFQTNLRFCQYPGVRRSLPSWALLRTLLARYLHVEPASIQFEFGVFGKPYIAGNSVHFNLARSREHTIVAIAARRRVGVDIEDVSHPREINALVQRILTQRELARLRDSSEPRQREMFFRYWVRKEALLKGIGTGLSTPMNRVDVSDSADSEEATVTIPTILGRAAEWKIYDLNFAGEDKNCVAAVAIESIAMQTRPGEEGEKR